MASEGDIALAVGAAVLGGIVGPLFQMVLPTRAGRTVNITGDNHGIVQQNDVDGRVIVTQTWITERKFERESKDTREPFGRHRRESANVGDNDDDVWLILFFGGIISAFAVAGYLRYQQQIVTGMLLTGSFSLAFLLSSLAWSRWKRVRMQGSLAFQNLVAVVLSIVVFVDMHYLQNPPFYEGAGPYQELVRLGRREGLGVFNRDFGMDGFLFLLYQLLGLVMAAVLLTLVILHAAKLLALANVAIGARPKGMWVRLAAFGGKPSGLLFSAVVAAVASVALVTGGVYSVLPNNAQIGELTPAVSPASASTTPSRPQS